MKQVSYTDMEYSCRNKKTKREEFLEIREEIRPLAKLDSVYMNYV